MVHSHRAHALRTPRALLAPARRLGPRQLSSPWVVPLGPPIAPPPRRPPPLLSRVRGPLHRYSGVVESWDGRAGQHTIRYDDGIVEAISITEEATRIYADPEEEVAVHEYSLYAPCFYCQKSGRLLSDVAPSCRPKSADELAAAELAAARGELGVELESVANDVAQLQRKLADEEAARARTEKEVSALQQSIAAKALDAASESERARGLQAELTQLRGRLEAAEAREREARESGASVSEQAASAESARAAADEARRVAEGNVSALTHRLSAADEQVASLQGKLKRAESEVAECRSQLNALMQSGQQSENDRVKADATIASLKQQLHVMRAYADVCWCALAVPAAATAAADRVIVLPFDQPQSA